jgi:hypothetical protein
MTGTKILWGQMLGALVTVLLGCWAVRNIADVLVGPEGALERRKHREKSLGPGCADRHFGSVKGIGLSSWEARYQQGVGYQHGYQQTKADTAGTHGNRGYATAR